MSSMTSSHTPPQTGLRPNRSPIVLPPSERSIPQEDLDAALTGSTRSLARRLFALNLQVHPDCRLPPASISLIYPRRHIA